jgi:ASCH domain-containing protein
MHLVQDLTSFPALSVRQPWASYLAAGLKTIELRSWSTPHRGWLWIHAGKKIDPVAMKLLGLSAEDFSCGGLIGLAKLETCLAINSEAHWLRCQGDHLSPGWYSGPCFGWRFSDAIALADIITCQGELRLFHLSQATVEHAALEINKTGQADFVKIVNEALSLDRLAAS